MSEKYLSTRTTETTNGDSSVSRTDGTSATVQSFSGRRTVESATQDGATSQVQTGGSAVSRGVTMSFVVVFPAGSLDVPPAGEDAPPSPCV